MRVSWDDERRNPYDLYMEEDWVEVEEEEEQEPPLPRYVEVVYCRDCRFRGLPFEHSEQCHWNEDECPDDEDYCSRGEKCDGTKAKPG